MTDDLHNINDLMDQLEDLAITTTQGSFIKKEDVRRLLEKRQAAGSIDKKEAPAPKNIHEARAQAKKFLEDVHIGSKPDPDLGRAIPASEPQPPSRA